MSVSLRVRLTAVYALVFGALLVTLSFVSYRVLASRLDDDASARLATLAEGLHAFVRFRGPTVEVVSHSADVSEAAFIHEATRYYRIYDLNTGRLLVDSAGFRLLRAPYAPSDVAAASARTNPFDVETTTQGRFRILSTVGARAPQQRYLLQVGAPLAAMDAALNQYLNVLIWRVPLVLMVAVLATWWMSRFALAPLARIAATAESIGISNLSARLPLRGASDELDDVARTFNDVLARLERAVADMRQFSAALAHELRTPLAALRGEIEMELHQPDIDEARRRAVSSQLEEIDKLKRLIDQILTLARAESGQIRLAFAPVNLAALASGLVEQLSPVAESRAVELSYDGEATAVLEADAGWLERVVLNLVDNALKFTKAGGHVTVRVAQQPDAVVLEVSDTGVGMSPTVLSRIFERFFRADPSRSSAIEGVGLGLSVVKWVVDSHGGRVHVNSRPDEGTTVIVWLPIAQPSDAFRPVRVAGASRAIDDRVALDVNQN
jgi:heavy metal sensor kinase